MTKVSVRPYSSNDCDQVNALIRGIQCKEQGIELTQPELHDIENFYQTRGNFWVAYEEGALIGTVALILFENHVAKLAKMFVASSHRGATRGVAAKLLATAITWGCERGVRALCLETVIESGAAQRFYLKHGFAEVLVHDLPSSFPISPLPSRYFIRTFS